MRTRAFGVEEPNTLLASRLVALTAIDVLISDLTGQVVDVRRIDPTGASGSVRDDQEAEIIARLVDAAEPRANEEAFVPVELNTD
jgi:2-C-methyl-D-erythritol 4-phosphate cytidylyltransferase